MILSVNLIVVLGIIVNALCLYSLDDIISLIHKTIVIRDTNGNDMIIKHEKNFFEHESAKVEMLLAASG